ncbi:MAG TPA: DoxX family protein [Cellvibrionaceae bacterium]|nr:DoxX family protein [Cellvibrionaceae bacterium]HMW72649.1 DoxX family protein [Cellvibrionaceae bacterium]HMY40278.1 DoxX family protein [Marinagarivorans sp.]HNG61605.1 DoxX family protein [Cellvibrionaceae bacterium]
MLTRLSPTIYHALHALEQQGTQLALLLIRLLLAVEFGMSGWEKFTGENWFAEIQQQFPWPFNWLPVNLSWTLSTWAELLGAAALVLGLGTRFTAISLGVVTWVATLAVHWPSQWHSLNELAMGYVITDMGAGNFKLPLIYGVLLLPLLTLGAGRISLDYWFRRRFDASFKGSSQQVLLSAKL